MSYQTIAIDLKVTPLIGDDGNVQMTIDQKVDDVIGNVTVDGNNQPIIGHREATSFVSCQDGQMIVLGGEQRTQKSQSQNKLGFLYEIPIISQILGGHTDDLERDGTPALHPPAHHPAGREHRRHEEGDQDAFERQAGRPIPGGSLPADQGERFEGPELPRPVQVTRSPRLPPCPRL